MHPLEYLPVGPATIGGGGAQSCGIHIVKHYITGVNYIEKRIPPQHITSGDMAREVGAMQQCRNCTTIVRLSAASFDYRPLGYGSIVMQHCELGSLDILILRFQARNRHLTDDGFVWKVFWDISLALCHLATGEDEARTRRLAKQGRSPTRRMGWNPIIHRDLKPSNVFLTMEDGNGPDADFDVSYPTCLLGDFGCSVSHADILAGRGRLDILPGNDVDFEPPEAPGYSEAGDVFSLGLIMQCLILMEQEPDVDRSKRASTVLRSRYAGEHVNHLVKRCLKTRSEERPRASELPRLVWMGYVLWRMGRRDAGAPLPGWGLRWMEILR